jgi:hypothetical protein
VNPWLSALVIAGTLALSAVVGRYVVQLVLWLASRSSDSGPGRPGGTTSPDAAPATDAAASDRSTSSSGGPSTGSTSTGATSADAPSGADSAPPPDQPGTLRGGTWIGVLERIAVTAVLLAGYPAGVAFVIAVKGLGRYPELREHPGSSERFVIGTLASLVWAAGCGLLGAALLGTRVLGV